MCVYGYVTMAVCDCVRERVRVQYMVSAIDRVSE